MRKYYKFNNGYNKRKHKNVWNFKLFIVHVLFSGLLLNYTRQKLIFASTILQNIIFNVSFSNLIIVKKKKKKKEKGKKNYNIVWFRQRLW